MGGQSAAVAGAGNTGLSGEGGDDPVGAAVVRRDFPDGIVDGVRDVDVSRRVHRQAAGIVESCLAVGAIAAARAAGQPRDGPMVPDPSDLEPLPDRLGPVSQPEIRPPRRGWNHVP